MLSGKCQACRELLRRVVQVFEQRPRLPHPQEGPDRPGRVDDRQEQEGRVAEQPVPGVPVEAEQRPPRTPAR